MSYTLGTYQNPDIKQQTIDLLNNLSGSVPTGGGVSIIPALFTNGTLLSSAAGTVAAGKNSVSILNNGAANGMVNGITIEPGTSLSWNAPLNGTLDSIPFDATGTSFIITYVEPI